MRSLVHTTPMGSLVSQWTDAGLYQLVWQDGSSGESRDVFDQAMELGDLLNVYFETGRADFSRITVDSVGWTPFRRQVYEACRQIPAGQIQTYGALAASVGSPGSARAVGAAMAANRTLLVIPCHRVIAANGKLQGFSGGDGVETKRRLIDLESRKTPTLF